MKKFLEICQTTSTPDKNGQDTSIQSETKDLAVHVGLLEPLKPIQTDWLLPQRVNTTLCSPHSKWYPATLEEIWDAMVATWTVPGITLKNTESAQILAFHTSLEMMVITTNAWILVLMDLL